MHKVNNNQDSEQLALTQYWVRAFFILELLIIYLLKMIMD